MDIQKNRLYETVLLSTKTYVKTDGEENIYNFTLKYFVYLNLCHSLKNNIVSLIRFHFEAEVWMKVSL